VVWLGIDPNGGLGLSPQKIFAVDQKSGNNWGILNLNHYRTPPPLVNK